MEVSELVAVT